jgi:hypothetical protein
LTFSRAKPAAGIVEKTPGGPPRLLTNVRRPQPLWDSFERHISIIRCIALIFVAPHFRSFSTVFKKNAQCGNACDILFDHRRREFQESRGAKMTGTNTPTIMAPARGSLPALTGGVCTIRGLFWVGLFMMLLAITIYVLSDDLAWRPRIKG